MCGFAAKCWEAARISIFAPIVAKAPKSGRTKFMSLSSSMAARLQHQHHTIREIIGNLPDTTLRREVNPGKWSALANIAHLAAYQPMFIARLQRIAGEDSPAFARYVAGDDPLFPAFLDRTSTSLLD